MIRDQGHGTSCLTHVHPGKSCLEYALPKAKTQLVTGLKISALFILLPELLKQGSKIVKDPGGCGKDAMKKFVRSSLYLAVYAALPAILMCVISRAGLPINRFTSLICFIAGGVTAYRFEPPSRHSQLLSYMLPKALECLARLLEIRGVLPQKKWHSSLALCLGLVAIGLGSLQSLRKHR